MRIRDLAQVRVSYGYRRLHILLQREGWGVNHKRVYRLYSEEGLMLRKKKPKRHVSCRKREERPVAAGVDESWSMDFMSDELFDGRRIRLLTIVDNFTRESLAIQVAASIRGQDVVDVLQSLKEQRRLPRTIRVDNVLTAMSRCKPASAILGGDPGKSSLILQAGGAGDAREWKALC